MVAPTRVAARASTAAAGPSAVPSTVVTCPARVSREPLDLGTSDHGTRSASDLAPAHAVCTLFVSPRQFSFAAVSI